MTITVGFMSKARAATYMVDDNVSINLFDKASATGKEKGESASKYVNRLLTWALENYKDEVRNPVAEQVPNNQS